jgi:phage gpG-like protein
MPYGSLHLEIRIDGVKELGRTFHGLYGDLSDLTPFFEAVADDWSETQEQVFAHEGEWEGMPRWADLNDAYARRKQAKHGDKPILEATGALKEAAVHPTKQITPTMLRLTVNNAYGIFHQSAEPRTVLPRRNFGSLTPRQKSRLPRLLRQSLSTE